MHEEDHQPGKSAITRLARAFLWLLVPGMVFVQLFITFRGLDSAPGMDHAQLARELARGNGFHTLMLRPSAWRQLLDHGHDVPPLEITDTINAPLPALVLAPVLKVFRPFWGFDAASNIFPLDRVVAAVGLLFFLASAGMAWVIAQRLFDARIAGWTLVMILACQFLWDVARSGLPQMMMLFFFCIMLDQFLRAQEKTAHGDGATGHALLMGLAGVPLVFSHWMALWLVLGLAFASAWLLRPRVLSGLLLLTPVLLALGAWGVRYQALCGDAFGGVKALLQAAMVFPSESWMLRDFSGAVPQTSAEYVLRKLATNISAQMQHVFAHFGSVIPALLFFVALFHPFRRPEVRAFSRALAVTWLFALVGMALSGLPLQEKDGNQLHTLFIPAMTAFGFAFLAVVWGRLGPERAHAGWWSRHALAASACIVSALPMIVSLPVELLLGLDNKNVLAHWPPYLPRQIHKVADYTQPDEVIVSDMPWAVAWYADRTTAWLPMNRRQFDEMSGLTERHQTKIAGIHLSPLSTKGERPAEVFTGEYREWSRLVFRGMGLGFGSDFLAQQDFPYREFVPLAGQPSDEPGRYITEMAFMTDRPHKTLASDNPANKPRKDAGPKSAANP